MKRFLSFILCMALTGSLAACGASPQAPSAASAPSTAAPTSPATDARQAKEQLIRDSGFEGVVTVMRGGSTVFESATGVADPQTGAPVTMDSLFCVGSLAKQFTAAAVLLLQERGKLHTDDTLDVYFPECPYGDKLTLRQLLTMRSGIAEFYEVISDGHSLNELPLGTLRKTVTNKGTVEGNRALLQEWLFAQPLTFAPGTDTEYCNSNYFLLARLVERVSGTSYESFVRENIFQPLHMDSTGFLDEMLDDPRLAQNALPAQTVYVGVTMGLGDIITNAADMQRWMTSFFDDTLLRAESRRQMTASDAYGFGVVPDGTGWYHTGIFTSYAAFDYVDPAQRVCVFAVTNNQKTLTYDLSQLCYALAER